MGDIFILILIAIAAWALVDLYQANERRHREWLLRMEKYMRKPWMK